MIVGFGVESPQLYLSDPYPDCQFTGLTHTGRCYWCHVPSHPERGQLLNCLDNALADLETWLKANKPTKLNQMCRKQ